MKNTTTTILLILTGIVLSVIVYKELKTKKSFLKMSDADKEKFVLDEEKKIWNIRNNPNLTQQEKDDAINKIAKEKKENYTDVEKKAMAEIWVKELQAGNIKLYLSPMDKGVFPTITGISTFDMPKTDYSNLSSLGLTDIDWSKIKYK
jgi:hypothetical protein